MKREKTSPAVVETISLCPSGRRRFELVDPHSYRFWEVEVTGRVVLRRHGTIGKPGRVFAREYTSERAALDASDRMVTDKLLDGYQELNTWNDSAIRIRGYCAFDKELGDPVLKRCVMSYAQTTRPFSIPRLGSQLIDEPVNRTSNQYVGGHPYVSANSPWPVNDQGREMQFLFQLDLQEAARILGEGCGTGLLQIWIDGHESMDGVFLRHLTPDDLSHPPEAVCPRLRAAQDDGGVFNAAALGFKPARRLQWQAAMSMHFPSVHDVIRDSAHRVRSLDLDEALSSLSGFELPDSLSRQLYRPLFDGLRGKAMPHVYLGGYAFAEGNGWDLHIGERRQLLTLWCDSGSLWQVCVSVDEAGQFHSGVSCTR